MSVFQKATRKQVRLRMALDGPPGSGKTFSALRFAYAIAGPTGRVAVINTESGAVEKYLGLDPDGIKFDFDIATLSDFAPSTYTSTIQAAGKAAYDVIIIDSLSHAWEGEGGALDQVDRKSDKNKFTAWKDVTPQHRAMIEAILRSPCHVIATMRTKVEHVLEEDERGKKVPRKVGMKPVQREGMEYEFDIVCDLDELHLLKVSKTRCPEIDNLRVMKPGAAFIEPVVRWLKDGSDISADFFAVNESDLKALQDRDRNVARQEPAKKVDFRAQLAGKTAAMLATSPAAPVETSPTAAPSDADEPCTDNQVLHIKGLATQIELPLEALKSALAKRNAASIKDLTYGQAESLIDGLSVLHAAKVKENREAQYVKDAAEKRRAAEATALDDDVPF